MVGCSSSDRLILKLPVTLCATGSASAGNEEPPMQGTLKSHPARMTYEVVDEPSKAVEALS